MITHPMGGDHDCTIVPLATEEIYFQVASQENLDVTPTS